MIVTVDQNCEGLTWEEWRIAANNNSTEAFWAWRIGEDPTDWRQFQKPCVSSQQNQEEMIALRAKYLGWEV